MKLAFPHYEGDSILRPFIAPAISTPVKVAKPAQVVQRNIAKIDADQVVFSGMELELQVRALRREYLRKWIKGIFSSKDA
jgi:hypothetical protein